MLALYGARVKSVSSRSSAAVKAATPPSSSQSATGQNSRGEILKVALQLFSDRGFDGVTMRELASAANVTTPTVYHFFKDKRGIYRAALLEAYDRMAFIAEAELAPGLSPQDLLYEAIMGQMARHDEDKTAYALFLRDMLDTDSSIRSEAVRDTFTTVYRSMIGLIRGLNPQLDPDAVTRLVMALFAGNRQMESFAGHLPPPHHKPVDLTSRAMMVRTFVQMVVTAGPLKP